MHKINPNEGTIQHGPSARLALMPALAVAAGMLLALGCDRDQVSHASVAKEAPAPAPAPAMEGSHGGAPMAMPPGAMPPGAMPPGAMPG